MLIIAATQADAEYYALHDLGFEIVSMTSLSTQRIRLLLLSTGEQRRK
jgi:hypothetical protein